MTKLDIKPSTKVHDLLIAYPGLEDKLIAIAPTIQKTKKSFS